MLYDGCHAIILRKEILQQREELKMKITKRNWGSCDERQICLFEIDNERGMRACVSNYGAILQSLRVQDRWGTVRDVVLGYDTLEEYIQSDTFFGAMVGPIADRIENGSFTIAGRHIQLPRNAGPDCMHSGPCGFHAQVWNWHEIPNGIAFERSFTEDDTGFPGCMDVQISYKVMDSCLLRLEYAAKCDCETALSFTNHSYFNLDGGRNHCRDHMLWVHADRYAETRRDEDPICTGKALPVKRTALDLRSGRKISDVLAAVDFREIRTGGGLDHFMIVNGSGMREHARLESRESGIRLICRSDAPGVLVYTANGLAGERGKGGAVYGRNWGVCLETERFPNAVNLPEYRSSVVLQPGLAYRSASEYEFSCFGDA